MTQYAISKRVEFVETVTEAGLKWLRTVFDVNAGPFENIFKIISFAAPFTGLGLWRSLVILFATKALGISPAQLGRKIDQAIGMKPGDKINTGLMPAFEKAVNGMLSKRANIGIDLYKEATILSALLKGGGAAKWLWKAVQKLLFVISGMFGIASIDKLYDMFAEPIAETIKETVSPEAEKLPLSYREKDVPPAELPSKPTALEELKKQLGPSREPVGVSSKEKEVSQMLEKLEEKYGLK